MKQNEKNITIPYFKDILKYKNKLNNFKYTLYHGFNNSKWNGGRTKGVVITEKDIFKINQAGFNLAYTFSNFKIDLNDKISLTLLKWLDKSQKKFKRKNEIILVNEKLRYFLKHEYNFILKFSITGHPNFHTFFTEKKFNTVNEVKEFLKEKNLKKDYEKIFSYYSDLFLKYDKVVIHSELVLDKNFIKFLEKYNFKNKAEVIINIINGCSFCPLYKNHYRLISEYIFKQGNSFNKEISKVMNCLLSVPPEKFTQYFFSFKDMNKIKKIYNNIKLEGRSLNNFNEFIKTHLEPLKILNLIRR